MAKLLSEIQDGVRRHARDGDIDLTSDEGLQNTNRVYREMQGSRQWPELRRQNTDLTTVGGTAVYDWPEEFKSLNILLVEMQDGADRDNYKLISQSPDELTWTLSGAKEDIALPEYYQRVSDSIGVLQVEFRPGPSLTGKTIRLTGILEHVLKDSNSRTIFHNLTADDAFELLLAADYLAVDGGDDVLGEQNQAKAGRLIS